MVNGLRVIRIDISSIDTATGRNGLAVQTKDLRDHKSFAFGSSLGAAMIGHDRAAQKAARHIRELANQPHQTVAAAAGAGVRVSFRWGLVAYPIIAALVVL